MRWGDAAIYVVYVCVCVCVRHIHCRSQSDLQIVSVVADAVDDRVGQVRDLGAAQPGERDAAVARHEDGVRVGHVVDLLIVVVVVVCYFDRRGCAEGV